LDIFRGALERNVVAIFTVIHADELDFLIKDNGRLERMTGLFARLAEDFALPVVLVNKLAT